MKNFNNNLKKPLSLSLITLCFGLGLGLAAFTFTNHASAAEVSKSASAKASLQQEALVLNTLAQDKTIQTAVQTANQAQASDQNKNNKPSKADLETQKNSLTTNPVAQRLLQAQKASQLKIVGMMLTDMNGNGLGQTMPVKTLSHPMAAKFVSAQIKTPKIAQKIKVSFNPTPVARITVGILDASNNNQVIGTLTEWIDMGNQ